MVTITLSSRAQRDLRRLDPHIRKRLAQSLRQLGEDPPPDNLDVKALAGSAPWLRLRVGDWRVLYAPVDDVILVARVVHRRDLSDAVSRL